VRTKIAGVLRLPLIVLLVALLNGIAAAESYVVSPKASDETKAAVAAGRPPQHGFPEIQNVEFTSSAQLRPGTNLQATVVTSPNVIYVEGRVKYWNVAFRQTATGKFDINYRVPFLPPGALGHWDLEVIARSVDGVEVKRTFPVTYRYF
jgi:hypothetical protein